MSKRVTLLGYYELKGAYENLFTSEITNFNSKPIVFQTSIGLITTFPDNTRLIYAMQHKRNLGAVTHPDLSYLTARGVMLMNVNLLHGLPDFREAVWNKWGVELSENERTITELEQLILIQVIMYPIPEYEKLTLLETPEDYKRDVELDLTLAVSILNHRKNNVS